MESPSCKRPGLKQVGQCFDPPVVKVKYLFWRATFKFSFGSHLFKNDPKILGQIMV